MRCLARVTAALTLAALIVPAGLASPVWARGSGGERTMTMVDTDRDGTIDLKEAQAAGDATFDKLETDKDGSLTTKELGGRVSKKDLKAADGDGDGTLDKKEFAALIEERFKAADPDGDGKLDAKEIKTPAGRSLMQLLK